MVLTQRQRLHEMLGAAPERVYAVCQAVVLAGKGSDPLPHCFKRRLDFTVRAASATIFSLFDCVVQWWWVGLLAVTV
jgi:hypothetical protein